MNHKVFELDALGSPRSCWLKESLEMNFFQGVTLNFIPHFILPSQLTELTEDLGIPGIDHV